MKKTLGLILAACVMAPVAGPGVAFADPPAWAPAHGKRAKDRVYDDSGRYYEPRRMSRDDHVWRGKDGKYYCRRENGTTGLIIGAGVGALVGREIDSRGDRTLGTILGAVGGGLLGREIDRGELKCR
ncbi:MAG: glycine zipper 2TM domain-containing protein [Sphingopyxis sp.]|nr:glycine zipper 2TM domain-containing protein [Sphingopyxis sp.]